MNFTIMFTGITKKMIFAFTFRCYFEEEKESNKKVDGTIIPFVSNAPFLYTFKTSENFKVFLCFHRVEKGCIGNEWA